MILQGGHLIMKVPRAYCPIKPIVQKAPPYLAVACVRTGFIGPVQNQESRPSKQKELTRGIRRVSIEGAEGPVPRTIQFRRKIQLFGQDVSAKIIVEREVERKMRWRLFY